MSSNSTMLPKKKEKLTDQVDEHHELLHRHGLEFVKHADWTTSIHKRVVDLEKIGGPGKVNGVLKVVWTFGIVWTLIGVILLVVLLR